MKKLLVLCMVVLCVLSAFAQGAKEETASKMKVALVLPGKADDVSFNQAMYRGMQEYAEKHSSEVELKYVENVYDVTAIEPALIEFADAKYDVIIGHGFQFSDPMHKVAKMYPNTVFLLGCGINDSDNVIRYDVSLEEGGYLMGVTAALASKTGKVGVIGGGMGSEITRGHEGFKAGAKAVNPAIEIQEVYTGDWNDTKGAYEAAIGMYDSGVDVIWHSGDGIGLGCVQAAQARDKYVLGNVENQYSLAPNNVLSGLQYEWAEALEKVFSDIKSGNAIRPKTQADAVLINVGNGGMSMCEINDPKGYLDDAAKARIKETIEKLSKGEIDLPEV